MCKKGSVLLGERGDFVIEFSRLITACAAEGCSEMITGTDGSTSTMDFGVQCTKNSPCTAEGLIFWVVRKMNENETYVLFDNGKVPTDVILALRRRVHIHIALGEDHALGETQQCQSKVVGEKRKKKKN